ncbi:MAG: sporulation protein [Phaeodactylibacter sp.]|nr:sporulation protein [Phaeodactylibacter sp.]MCB9267460.1 sporulation protein [Lewinellaceae bacterium]MCB9288763.1 sporulation protein [Lewinellaceae bacterium]
MKINLEDLVPKITDFLRSEAKTETVIGKQFQLGEFNCVPVIRLGMGFGSGGGEGDAPQQGHGQGMGLGGGIGIEPIGFLVTRGTEISFISTRTKSSLSNAFDKAPELLEKFLEQQKMKKEETVEA